MFFFIYFPFYVWDWRQVGGGRREEEGDDNDLSALRCAVHLRSGGGGGPVAPPSPRLKTAL